MPNREVLPPLSYSIPSFSRDGYANVDGWLNQLAQWGFSWVTFTPTFQVEEFDPILSDPYLLLNMGFTPSFRTISRAVRTAIELGLNVKIEPHLDFDTVFEEDGEADWRLRMYFDPSDHVSIGDNTLATNGYVTDILDELIEIFAENKDVRPIAEPERPPCFALTLGSEVDVSLFQFSAEWTAVLNNLKGLRSINGLDDRLAFGHKLNHDTLSNALGHVRQYLNSEREDRDLNAINRQGIWQLQSNVESYLNQLDYVSFSFYSRLLTRDNAGRLRGLTLDWGRETTEEDIDAVAESFNLIAQARSSEFGDGPALDIGEFGLGSTDPMEPYADEPGTLLDGQTGQMSESARNMRRKYYKGLLRFLTVYSSSLARESAEGDHCRFTPVTFWTVGQYDIMGLFDVEMEINDESVDSEEFVDPEIVEAIQSYNRESYSDEPVEEENSVERRYDTLEEIATEIVAIYRRLFEAGQLSEEDCERLREVRQELNDMNASEALLREFDALLESVCGQEKGEGQKKSEEKKDKEKKKKRRKGK